MAIIEFYGRRLKREEREADCPRCKAEAGNPCQRETDQLSHDDCSQRLSALECL